MGTFHPILCFFPFYNLCLRGWKRIAKVTCIHYWKTLQSTRKKIKNTFLVIIPFNVFGYFLLIVWDILSFAFYQNSMAFDSPHKDGRSRSLFKGRAVPTPKPFLRMLIDRRAVYQPLLPSLGHTSKIYAVQGGGSGKGGIRFKSFGTL